MTIINTTRIFSVVIFCVVINYTMKHLYILQEHPTAQGPIEQQLLQMGQEPTKIPGKRNYSDPRQVRFANQTLAYEILSQIDVYKPLEQKYYTIYNGARPNFSEPWYGYRPDFRYCERVRKHFTQHPESVFEEKPNMLIVRADQDFTRKEVVPNYYTMIDPNIRENMPINWFKGFNFNLKANVSAFVSLKPIYMSRELGTQYSCLSQISNQLPGHNSLGRKDTIADLATKYGNHFEKQPECFNYDKYFPKTWVMYNKEECQEFFKILDTPEYAEKKAKQRIVYMRKVGAGSHKGQGVQPVNEQEEKELREMYDNGQKCGMVKKNYIVQHFIVDPLLIHDYYKFDFRVFMLIASTNPLMAFYHDGYIRISLIPYNSTSDNLEDEKKMMLTNLMLNKEIYEDARNGKLYRGMDEQGLMNAQQATVDKLGEYLLEKGMVTDPNWTENYLRKEMRRAMLHLAKMSQKELKKDSTVFHLFGVDFMLDSQMNLWFIEANAGPAYPKFVPSVHQNMYEMVKGQFDIVFGLLRSRMKRTINFVNQISRDGSVSYDEQGNLVLTNLARKRHTMSRINQNYFEEEFKPKPDNRFALIIDEGKQDPTERYAGLIDPQCYDILGQF